MIKISISLILPTYNEEENIKQLIELSTKEFEKAKIKHEMIVVDDLSSDRTVEIVSELMKSYPNLKLIKRQEKGLATAVRRGFDEAKMDYLMAIDTDLSHHPRYFKDLFKYHKQYDIVRASRFIPSKGGMKAPFYRILASKIINTFIKYILLINLTDFTGGFYIINKSKLNLLPKDYIFKGYGDYFIRLLFLAKRKKYSIKEVGYTYIFRTAGTTKTSFLKQSIKYFIAVLKIRFKFLF